MTVHLMELLQMLVFVGVWLLFLVVIGYGFGIGGARRSAWTAPGQKIPGYVEIRSPRLARLLVSRYEGYSDKLRTNIGALFNHFYLNRWPNCISHFGIFDWCVTVPLTAWWGWEITRYFFVAPLLEQEFGNGVPTVVLTLGLYRMVMHFVGAWNNAEADKGPALTKEELRAALEKEETS